MEFVWVRFESPHGIISRACEKLAKHVLIRDRCQLFKYEFVACFKKEKKIFSVLCSIAEFDDMNHTHGSDNFNIHFCTVRTFFSYNVKFQKSM